MPAQLHIELETRLRLLTRDGAAFLAFQPKLTADQYTALLDAARQAVTRDELYDAAIFLARQWAVEVQFDE